MVRRFETWCTIAILLICATIAGACGTGRQVESVPRIAAVSRTDVERYLGCLPRELDSFAVSRGPFQQRLGIQLETDLDWVTLASTVFVSRSMAAIRSTSGLEYVVSGTREDLKLDSHDVAICVFTRSPDLAPSTLATVDFGQGRCRPVLIHRADIRTFILSTDRDLLNEAARRFESPELSAQGLPPHLRAAAIHADTHARFYMVRRTPPQRWRLHLPTAGICVSTTVANRNGRYCICLSGPRAMLSTFSRSMLYTRESARADDFSPSARVFPGRGMALYYLLSSLAGYSVDAI